MIISKNSWHFKLNSQWGSHELRYTLSKGNKISLCQYLWETMKSLLGLIASSLSIIFLIGCCLYVISSPLVLLFSTFTGIWWNIPDYYTMGMTVIIMEIILGTIYGMLATLFGPMKVFPKWLPVDKWFGIAIDKSLQHTPKKVNIFVEYVKAKKAKVCPMIEFKGE